MALAQRSIMERLTVNRDGVVEVLFSIVVANNDVELASAPHAVLVEPGRNIAAVLADVNATLAGMGYGAIETKSAQRVVELVAAAHTAAVVTEYKARLASQIRA